MQRRDDVDQKARGAQCEIRPGVGVEPGRRADVVERQVDGDLVVTEHLRSQVADCVRLPGAATAIDNLIRRG